MLFLTNTGFGAMSLKTFLYVFRDCYVGIRTIYARVLRISSCLSVLTQDDEKTFDSLPRIVQIQVLKRLEPQDIEERGKTEMDLHRQYLGELSSSRESENNFENVACEMCMRLRALENPYYEEFNIEDLFIFEGVKLFVNPEVQNLQKPLQSLLIFTGIIKDTDSKRAMLSFVLKEHMYDPMRLSEIRFLDAKIFPWLLPNGLFGWDHPRAKGITISAYLRARLLSCDRRFARSQHYIIFAANVLEQRQITSCCALSVRLFKAAQTVAEIQRILSSQNFTDQMLICSMFSEIRGSVAYWRSVKYVLKTFVKTFGPPTFFLTFNPAIREWTALHTLYSSITGYPVSCNNIYAEVAKDPVIFQRFFHAKIRALERFINGPKKPLGTIVHSFKRVEYQSGGLSHVHCFLWIKGRCSNEEVNGTGNYRLH
uniref:Helitron helicase-like domain-containing protein n=1 Tax=Panagrolaimus sp. ES5 TaxID=591445 RepID=A0AC34FJW2_9BILA